MPVLDDECHRQYRELLSWQLLAALLARLPVAIDVAETHPGGGQYDCLAVLLCRGRAVATPVR